jgi:hypothetical protein
MSADKYDKFIRHLQRAKAYFDPGKVVAKMTYPTYVELRKEHYGRGFKNMMEHEYDFVIHLDGPHYGPPDWKVEYTTK